MMVERDEKAVISELVRRMNETSIRIKDLENRVSRIERNFASLSENFAREAKEFTLNFDDIFKKISQTFSMLEGINAEILKIKKELESFAKRTEVKELEKFVELISPITSRFVTKDEIERILEEKLRK
jgi:predicted RNase H-like nuclease (RuvC/YqgF family)